MSTSTSRETVIDVTTPRAAPRLGAAGAAAARGAVAGVRGSSSRATSTSAATCSACRAGPATTARTTRSRTCSTGRCSTRSARHDRVLELYKQGLEGHFRQYTEAKTTEVELGRDGMYYQEFHACFDWFHHGEAWSPIVLQGLSDPDDRALIARGCGAGRAGTWARTRTSRTTTQQHKVIRSFFNGSRGPLLRKATALDWAGDPIEVAGRFDAGHGETTFEEMLDHFRDYTDVVGDNPSTSARPRSASTAYALTGEAKYRDWAARVRRRLGGAHRAERRADPDAASASDGTIESGYGWYGGVYGWGFSVLQVAAQRPARPPRLPPRARRTRFANALLLTGDRRYVDVWRTDDRPRQRATRNKRTARRSTRTCTVGWTGWSGCSRARRSTICRRRGQRAGTSIRPQKFAPAPHALYYWTLDRSVLDLAGETPRWVALPGRRGRRLPGGGAAKPISRRCAARSS